MQFSLLSAAWLLHTFQGALGLAILPNAQSSSLSRRQDLTQAATELRSQLSSAAVVTFPDDAGWDELQIRGSSPRVSPAYSVVVEVASESDVVKTVKIANKYDVPFLAVSGTHGWTETLNKLPYGFQVRMRKLNTATLSTDGKTATIGGGMLQWEITRALFAKGKYAGTHAFFHPPSSPWCLRTV
jgi:FAD/FMN-containing dehydrogenase